MSNTTAIALPEIKIEASLTGRGSSASVVCSLGDQTVHRDRIDPAKAADRKRFSAAVVASMGDGFPITTDDIDAELLATADRLDAIAADTRPASNAPPAIGDGEELDASQVIRPELIIRPDVSAIAIPRLVSVEGQVVGDWLHYVRSGDDRRVERLGDRLTMPNAADMWLSPTPGTPTPTDVRKFNRWSPDSREAWASGKSSPTTAEVLRMVAERINRYVVLPPDDAPGHGLTLAAWVMMTYIYPALPAVPYLHLSAAPGSGKTRVMDVLSQMVFRPFSTSNASAPVIFRTRHTFGGVLILDEAERMRDTRSPDVAEILSILLAGYRRGGSASRMEPCGDTYRSVSFDCYGPAVLGCVKGLPPALSSRCITVRMMRASKGDERVERSLNDTPGDAAAVLDALHCWALDHAADVIACPKPSSSLINRDAELWGPLLRIVAHTGDADAVALLVEHAEKMTRASADDATPEFDELLLTALYRLRQIGETPTAGEVLERARMIDPESLDQKWTPRMVGGIVRRYSPTSKSNGRRVFRDEPETISDISTRYGYDIRGGE